MRRDKWVKRWQVPSSSDSGVWTVAVDADGNYGCSCPVWRFRRQECHHIKMVKEGIEYEMGAGGFPALSQGLSGSSLENSQEVDER